MRLLYLGLPLGAEMLRRHGHVPVALGIGHLAAPGRRRLRRIFDRSLILGKPDLSSPDVLRALESSAPDAILSWFWPRKIPTSVLALAPGAAFGVHPSLLPRHRGPDPFFHAIRQGDTTTGVTLHRLEAEFDTGDIIDTRTLTIGDDDAWRLAKRLDRLSIELLVSVADRLARRDAIVGRRQDPALATEAPRPSDEDLAIDWELEAEEVMRIIRAGSPRPGASASLGDELVIVMRARPYVGRLPSGLEPGDAVRSEDGVVVRCGQGAVLLTRIEREEGELVDGADIGALVPDRLLSDA